MIKNLLALLIGFALLGVALAAGSFVLDRLATNSEDRSFRSAFREVELGMPERRLIELLGEPDEQSATFFLAQENGHEAAYRRAAESGSVRYLVWRCCLDHVYSAGLNASGEVAVAEAGGT